MGRVAHLGDLYDARKDNFLHVSIYTANVSGDAVELTANAYTNTEYVQTETLWEKMAKLGISGSLSASFIAGLVSGSGSAGYLNDFKRSPKSAKASLVYKVRTFQEDLKIFSNTSVELVNKILLENIDATHVVVGVEWGADAVISVEETNTHTTNTQEVQGKLEAALKEAMMAPQMSLSGSVQLEGKTAIQSIEKSNTFSLRFHGDVIPESLPGTIEESITLIKNIPKLIEKENEGKGKEMSYILMPISTVRKVFQLQSRPNPILQELNSVMADKFMRIFQEIKDSQLHIDDVYHGMDKWNRMIPEKDLKNGLKMKSEFDSYRNDLQKKFTDRVVRYRNGTLPDESELLSLITEYESSNWTRDKIDQFLESYTPTMQKIMLMNLFERYNASFIYHTTDLYKILTKHYQEEIRIISVDLSINISSPYVNKIISLLKGGEKSKKVKYYIDDDSNLEVPKVEAYFEGKVIHSFLIGKRELVALIHPHQNPYVIVMDGNSYEQIAKNHDGKLKNTCFAVVKDRFYSIVQNEGRIYSTDVGSIVFPPEGGIVWNYVGSFPKESYVQNIIAAVDEFSFYFVTYSGALYKYDTLSKTVSKQGNIAYYHNVSSLIFVNRILYMYIKDRFYSFDGTSFTELKVEETRNEPSLFEFEGKVCVAGGIMDISNGNPVSCYDPIKGNWNVMNHLNVARKFPGVVTTQSGTIVIGGYDSGEIRSAEILKPNDKIWSHIQTPSDMEDKFYLVTSFHY